MYKKYILPNVGIGIIIGGTLLSFIPAIFLKPIYNDVTPFKITNQEYSGP